MTARHFSSLTEIDTAFNQLEVSVSKEDARSFKSTKLQDVWEAAKSIERHLEKRKSLRNFRRLQPFLSGIEQYSRVVEVICNGTPYLPYLWAPIKLLLQLAQGHFSALEKLIDAYGMIGEVMPRFDKLSKVFEDDQQFQLVLGYFYADILEFHRRAYKLFRQRGWHILFDSLWRTFDSRFQTILESLRRHRDLVDQEAEANNIVEAKAWRMEQVELFRKWRIEREEEIEKRERERLVAQFREAVTWIAADSEQEDILVKLSRVCHMKGDHWILKNQYIIRWLGNHNDVPILWLNGKPGAGKSVICSQIIKSVQDKENSIIIYYFCTPNSSIRHINEMLRSLSSQLLAANRVVAPYVLETFANHGLQPSRRSLSKVLEKLIGCLPYVRIVIDGLDECSLSDQADCIDALKEAQRLTQGVCKVLLSSRKVSLIVKYLKNVTALPLEENADEMNRSISSFVDKSMDGLRGNFSVETIDYAKQEICRKANGMFLWVRLVMFSLENSYSESHVRAAIDALPEGLEALYDKIILQICGNGTTTNQKLATRILQWLLVAQRPLKRYELECGIILDEQITRITDHSQVRGDVMGLCNPIVDVAENSAGIVSFTHFTVQEYLQTATQSPLRQLLQAQFTVSLSCITYLAHGLELSNPEASLDQNYQEVLRGFHDLMPYAGHFWQEHVTALAKSNTCQYSVSSLRCAMERLTQRHDELNDSTDPHSASKSSNSEFEDLWNLLGLSTGCRSTMSRALRNADCVTSMNEKEMLRIGTIESSDTTGFLEARKKFQLILEELLSKEDPTDSLLESFKIRHGHGDYACRYQNCPRALQGFGSEELRGLHEESHIPKFRCMDSSCTFPQRTFKTRGTLRQHTQKYHDRDISCSLPGSLRALPKSINNKFSPPDPSSRGTIQAFTSSNDEPTTETEIIAEGETSSQSKEDSSTHAENFLAKLKLDDLSDDYKQEENDYTVTYNPRIERKNCISCVQTVICDSYAMSTRLNIDDSILAIGYINQVDVVESFSGKKISTLTLRDLTHKDKVDSGCHVCCLDFSPCGTYLAAGISNSLVQVWHLKQEVVHRTYSGHDQTVHDLCYSSDGKWLLSGSEDRTARLWNVGTGMAEHIFEIPDPISSVAISPNTSLIAVGSLDNHVRIWDRATKKLIFTSELIDKDLQHQAAVHSISFGLTGTELLSASIDKAWKKWGGDGFAEVETHAGHQDEVMSIASLSWQNLILAASGDGGVQIWQASSGVPLLFLLGHEDAVITVSPSRSRNLFATASPDEKVRLWRIDDISKP